MAQQPSETGRNKPSVFSLNDTTPTPTQLPCRVYMKLRKDGTVTLEDATVFLEALLGDDPPTKCPEIKKSRAIGKSTAAKKASRTTGSQKPQIKKQYRILLYSA